MEKRKCKLVLIICTLALLISTPVLAASYSFSFSALTGTQYSPATTKVSGSSAYAVQTSGGTLSLSKYITARVTDSNKNNISNTVNLVSVGSTYAGTYSTSGLLGKTVLLKGTTSTIGCAASGSWTP